MPKSFTSPLDGTPNTVYVATTEEIPYAFDFTPMLLGGESVAAPAGVLADLTLNGAAVTLTDAATTSGTAICIQNVDGAILAPGHVYRLVVSADVTGIVADKRLSISVVIQCPY